MENAIAISFIVLSLVVAALAVVVRLIQNNLNDQISDLRERVYNLEGD